MNIVDEVVSGKAWPPSPYLLATCPAVTLSRLMLNPTYMPKMSWLQTGRKADWQTGCLADRLVADRLVADRLVADRLVADRLVGRQAGWQRG